MSSARDLLPVMTELETDPRPTPPQWKSRAETRRAAVFRSTYRQGDFAALCDLFGENSKEIQYAGMAGDIVPQARDHGRQDVLPCLHLNRQDRKADAELNPDRLWTWCKLLEQDQNLVAETREVAIGYLRRKIVRNLPPSVSISYRLQLEWLRLVPFLSALSRRTVAPRVPSTFGEW
jgi:hypothetical protein